MIELVICDWDGTLMDSQARIVHAMRLAFEDLGEAPPAAAAVRQIIGLGLHDAVTRLAPALDSRSLDALAARYRQAFLSSAHIPSPLFEAVPAALEALAADGMLLAVATGKSRAGLDRALAESALAHRFVATRTVDECPAKPHPAMIIDILDELGIQPSAAVMVGDTTFDLDMAAAAGVHGAGVCCGSHGRTELAACRPAWLLDDFSALPAVLRQRNLPLPATRRP